MSVRERKKMFETVSGSTIAEKSAMDSNILENKIESSNIFKGMKGKLKTGKLTKKNIGNPTDFKHILHPSWDINQDDMQSLCCKVGISETQLQGLLENTEPSKHDMQVRKPDANNQKHISLDKPQTTNGRNQNERKSLAKQDLAFNILLALRGTTDDTPQCSPNIHEQLAHLWSPILKKGMGKEDKDKLIKQYVIPENCALLKAPKLNSEISAAVTDDMRAKDERLESVQQQLGVGITALNRGLELLLHDGTDKLQAIKFLRDSSRILCDLHYAGTAARKEFITTGLDEVYLNVIQDVDRDKMLFLIRPSPRPSLLTDVSQQSPMPSRRSLVPSPSVFQKSPTAAARSHLIPLSVPQLSPTPSIRPTMPTSPVSTSNTPPPIGWNIGIPRSPLSKKGFTRRLTRPNYPPPPPPPTVPPKFAK